MKRLLIVYNPRSSRAVDVSQEVLKPARLLKGYMVGKYEVVKIGIEQNIKNLAKLLKDNDILVAAGGDATGVIAVNAIMQSGRDVTLAVLPYGNFNDLARILQTKNFKDIFNCRCAKLFPLEIIVDGELVRYATCYVTIGMMAEAVQLYDSVKMRKVLKSWWGRYVGSYLYLAGWYFKNRRRKGALPEFKLNGKPQMRKTSDYMAVNGASMARVMKGNDCWIKPHVFQSNTGRFVNFFRLMRMMIKSMLIKVPGVETQDDILEFVQPSRVKIQAEGESLVFENAKKIEIRKSKQSLKVITN